MGMLDRFRLDGKRLFITGGSRGLGREMAFAIADAGADVALTGRDQSSLERTAADIHALGRKAWAVQADMGDPSACEAACAKALEDHRPFDILINNVGGRRDPTPVHEMPVETWRKLVDLNLTSTFICTKIIGGAMVSAGKGGRVINIASINAFITGQNIGGQH
jgi:gluconate 5-dehydrogenase